MIKSFAHKGLEKLFYNNTKKGINAEHSQKLLDIMDRLESGTSYTVNAYFLMNYLAPIAGTVSASDYASTLKIDVK